MKLDFNDPSPLVATVARLFARKGQAKEVAVLAHAASKFIQTHCENSNGFVYCSFNLVLQVPYFLFAQLEPELGKFENTIAEKVKLVLRAYPHDHLKAVIITPSLSAGQRWQEEAMSWLGGNNISNQGRVRLDDIAVKACDGLLFRSQAEVNLYQALKSKGITFAPLPVFLRGGQSRVEPSFLIVKRGIMTMIKIDGDSVQRETPIQADARAAILVYEEVRLERVRAIECMSLEAAEKCADSILSKLEGF